MVAKDAVYDLRLTMSGKGLPAGQDTGYALLDEQGITTSEFQQQVTYQRALEGELSKTLESLDGVRSAVVHVALPKDEVFVTEQSEPTASVLLDLAAGTDAVAASRSRPSPTWSPPASRTWSPSRSPSPTPPAQVLSAPGTGMTAAAGDARSQVEQEYEARLAANAQRILDQVLGPGRAVVSVRADVDLVPAAVDVGDLHLHRRHAAALGEHDHRGATPAAAPSSAACSARRTCPTRRRTPAAATPRTTRSRRPTNNAVDKTVETVESARRAPSTG